MIAPTIEIRTCPACGRDRFRPFHEQRYSDIDLRYVICRYCSLVFLSPRFDEQDLATFYQAEYRQRFSGDENPTADNLVEQVTRAEHLAGAVTSEGRIVRSHLDIGCSAGELLQAVRRAFAKVDPFVSVGVEPSEAHRAWCARNGLTVFPTLDQAAASGAGPFDLITLSHVLEHISDPPGFLRHLRAAHLSPTGALLVEVPNLFGHGSFEMTHLFAFTAKTLEDTLGVAGFRMIWKKLHSVSREGPRGLRYITVLAVPAPLAEGRAHPIRRVSWQSVTARRTQWLLGLGSRPSNLVTMLPSRVWGRVRRVVSGSP